MGGSTVEREHRATAVGVAWKALMLTAFAVVMFFAGRLWSVRQVREAQRAAGQAEERLLAIQAELVECRNARLLEGADP